MKSRERVKEKIIEIFEKWDHELSIGMLPEDIEQMLEEIINCLKENTDEKHRVLQ